MKEYKVIHSSKIKDRGTAIFFDGEPADLPIVWGKEVSVSVLKPDGTKSIFIGRKEYARKPE